MTQPSGKGRSTRVSQIVKAPREVVYRAFLEPDAVTSWLPPDGMRGNIQTFEPHEGGKFRMSLTYLDRLDSPRGKTSEDTDTFEGRFVELLPNEKIVWVVEFESDQPDFAGRAETVSEDLARLSDPWHRQISSVQVKAGTWDFFTEAGYGGETMRLSPGDYPALQQPWDKAIGSMMCIEPGQ